MPNIFEYTDYRKFLNDYYGEKKKASPSFSYNALSLKAGIKSKGFLHDVMHGAKNLSKQTVVKLSEALGFRKNEAEYFENLVFFNQAADLKERNIFYDKMSSVKTGGALPEHQKMLTKDQYDFYSKWHHAAVRSLIHLHGFKGDYKWLARNVYPAITPKQAKQSVELLLRLGLVEKQDNGVFRLTEAHITTGNEVVSLAVLNFHKEAARLAADALEQLPREKRNVTGLTMGISGEMYEKICEEIKKFRAKLVGMVDKDKNGDRVYQMNFHLFPLSRTDIKKQEDL